MTSIDVSENSPRRVVLGEKRSRKAQPSLAVRARILVHVRDQTLRQRNLCRGKSLQTCLKCSHQHGRGNALAGDVGYGKHHAILFIGFSWTRKHVVIISSHRVGRARGIGNSNSRNLRRCARQKPGLDLACNLQIALHHHAVGDLQHEQEEKQQAAPEMKIEFDHVGFVIASLSS